ncbi:hypothetical protein PHYSODRAFT_501791, partial [Phytophthora sojae]
MRSPPVLLCVAVALPTRVQALPHVTQLISDLLIPTTLDAAIYNDLQRVLGIYESSLPVTFRAMDGAAARGRLDILQKLHDTRQEGCSSAAFLGAAENNHVNVLRWLYDFYIELCNPPKELAAAATNGHVQAVEMLRE